MLKERRIARRVAAACCAAVLACGERTEPSIFGDWTIGDHVAADQSPMTPGEAQRWHGTSVGFDAKRAGLFTKTCTAPDYQRWTVSQRHFESDYGIPAKRLGITTDSVRIIHIECRDGSRRAGIELIVLERDKLVFLNEGVFFLLTRAAAVPNAAVAEKR